MLVLFWVNGWKNDIQTEIEKKFEALLNSFFKNNFHYFLQIFSSNYSNWFNFFVKQINWKQFFFKETYWFKECVRSEFGRNRIDIIRFRSQLFPRGVNKNEKWKYISLNFRLTLFQWLKITFRQIKQLTKYQKKKYIVARWGQQASKKG